jgi:glutamate-1-semialdehyde 2,1-aminomutase
VPPETAAHTLVLDYNNETAVAHAFEREGRDIAAVIVEPVAGNMNLVAPRPGFLESLRKLCTEYGSVLIFDEVMTGCRVALGGAQWLYGIKPDLTTLGKVIGGGLPVAALGGRRDLMQWLAPTGPVYQAGTLSGNPVAIAAGLATLKLVQAPGFFDRLGATTRTLCSELTAAARESSIPFCADNVGGMLGLYFRSAPPASYAEVMQCDKEMFNRFFHAMLAQGVYFAPSAYEAGFVSAAHGDADIEKTVSAAKRVFAEIGAAK